MKPPLILYACLAAMLVCACRESKKVTVPLYPGNQYFLNVCPDEVAAVRVPSIFGGCDLTQCYPDFDPTAGLSLDWDITLSHSSNIESVELLFTGTVDLSQMEGEIDPNTVSGSEFQPLIKPGSSQIVGIAPAAPATPTNLQATPKISLVAGAVINDSEILSLKIDQKVGDIVVSEYNLSYTIRNCDIPDEDGTTDQIVLTNVDASTPTLAILDIGRGMDTEPDCDPNDEIFKGANSISPGNIRTDGCSDRQFLIMAPGKGLFTSQSPFGLTSAEGQTVTITLPEPTTPPVIVWIVDSVQDVRNDLFERARDQMNLANALYSHNLVGIQFDVDPYATFVSISDPEKVRKIATAALWDREGPLCDGTPNIYSDTEIFKSVNSEDVGMINVYYVNQPFTGKTCSDGERKKNLIFIGNEAAESTLSHEFGHAFSLAHVQFVEGISTNNLMWHRIAARDGFTQAQSLRMNIFPLSVLNTNNPTAAASQTRNCPDTRSDDECPDLALQVTLP